MILPVLILCARLVVPCQLFGSIQDWTPEDKPKWQRYGEIVVGLLHSQGDAKAYFVRQCYQGKTLSAAFGINWNFGQLTEGHLTALRQLLLIGGVEPNPGPVDLAECQQCQQTFKRNADLNQHLKVVHGEKTYTCDACDYATTKESNLIRHTHQIHQTTSRKQEIDRSCSSCSYTTNRPANLKRHMLTHQKPVLPVKHPRFEESDEEIQSIVGQTLGKIINKIASREQTALRKRYRCVTLEATGNDPLTYLESIASKIKDYVEYELEVKKGIKLQLELDVEFKNDFDTNVIKEGGFRTYQQAIYRGSDYDVTEGFPKILEGIEKYIKDGSGWVINQLLELRIKMVTCKPLRGGSTFRKIPDKLKNKRVIVNVKNSDEKCFLWSMLAHKHKVDGQDHPNRVSHYKQFEQELNMKDIEYPVAIKDIQKFENQNPYAINVYGFDDDLFPLRISKVEGKERIHLLYHEDHYSLIRSLDSLLFDQTKYEHRKFFCPMCLIPRTTQQLLNAHMELCKLKEPTRITMPEDQTLEFTNHHRTLRQPLVIMADFECLTETVIAPEPSADPGKSYTKPYQKHTPCGYGMVQSRSCSCSSSKTEFKKLEVECCKEPVKEFFSNLIAMVIDYHNEEPKEMTDFDLEKHSSNTCHICKEIISERKVKDHCHTCGKYRGPAHNKCNQALRLNKDVVVVFHNLRKYDGHLIMTEIGQVAELNGFKIDVVAKAMEDYISFSLTHKKEYDGKGGAKDFGYKIKFIDSLAFLNNSLSGLVENLDTDKFKAMESEFSPEQCQMLRRKGVYPYDYMNSWEKFEEKQLPEKDKFFSQLSGDHISDADYGHANRVWKFFPCIQNMKDYHDLYLKTDVLLLADVFENFRVFSMEKYGLDPCHYMTAPALAWDACLKMTGVKLELLEDPEMYLFCESGIRGGISMISHRYAKANNPYMDDYKPDEPTSYIVYLDANNLYGWAMVQSLPLNGFKWLQKDDFKNIDWRKIDPNGVKGYFIEVDLEYPEVLHDKHSDYPLAPETMEISEVSDYCKKLKEIMQIKAPVCKKNLFPIFFKKKKYILHLRNLQLYLRLGMEIKEVHRVIEFNQRPWLKDYINFNTEMRKKATSAFDKDLLKLMNNAVFGKTMENVRNYRNIELVSSAVRFEKLTRNPRFKDCCKFNENLVGVSSLKPSTNLNKPIYCGLTVLDLSKVLMYEFHYDYMIPRFENEENRKKLQLLFTDTDSLCYQVHTDDIYKIMKEDSDRFDFSDYERDHPCYSITNKKVIGKMKDEAEGKIIEEFVGLRPKMYSIQGEGIKKKRAKGIKRAVVKNVINHADYRDTLMNETFMMHSMNQLRTKLHKIYSVTINKRSLSAYDDKRWLLDNIKSRAHGHKDNKI